MHWCGTSPFFVLVATPSTLLTPHLFVFEFQVAFQALDKVEPITHAIANVGKRVFVIGFSILALGNAISTQTAIGSAVAIAGAGLYRQGLGLAACGCHLCCAHPAPRA